LKVGQALDRFQNRTATDSKRTAIVVSIAASITWTWLDGESELDSRIDERETGNSVPK
jgi:hypothetical protein